jgi:MYXO-CTERM domain-containing protein
MPPCPTAGGGPPGHNKGEGSTTRPCGSKDDHGKGGSGVVIVLPLALLGAAATGRRRLVTGIRRVHGATRRRSA